MQIFLKTFFVIVLFYVPIIHAGGESENLESEFAKCGEFTSYSEIEFCFSQTYSQSDKFLNREYSQLIQYLDGLENKIHKKRLVNTQRTWIKFRDSDCKFYSDGQAVRLNKCLSERTIQRLKELESFNVNYAMGCNGCPW
ncbi:lysozyme inhibitor LprI family protein [Microbulbifer epialgicus]|uniref:Lysozyme inhibitor LprI family protein n=1 Tax=Microbulbifer epialgicus TaxID=393907 RepID=A0ABV4P840_9GAMM